MAAKEGKGAGRASYRLVKTPTPTLRSPHFVLRPLTRSDAPALFPSFADPEVMRWGSRDAFASEAELADYLVPEEGWDGGRSWAVVESESGPAIGPLAAINRRDKIVELGYVVTRDRQGERITRETPVALIDHLLDTESRRQICADTDPDNLASNRLLERLGFTLEAVYASTALRTSAFATARSGGLPNARRTLSGRRTHTHTPNSVVLLRHGLSLGSPIR